jgi:hypothetical protein
MNAINEYRDLVRSGLLEMMKAKPQTGVWSPSCAQHGFSDSPSLNSPNYRVPGLIGKGMIEAIQQFLSNPVQPPVDIDKVNWPDNKGCNGLSNNFNLRKKALW